MHGILVSVLHVGCKEECDFVLSYAVMPHGHEMLAL